MVFVLLLILQERTTGGHGLLEALPRIYQVTPDIPDRRRATKQMEVRPLPGRQPQRASARRRSGPSLQRRTSPTPRIKTASLDAALLIASGRVVVLSRFMRSGIGLRAQCALMSLISC